MCSRNAVSGELKQDQLEDQQAKDQHFATKDRLRKLKEEINNQVRLHSPSTPKNKAPSIINFDFLEVLQPTKDTTDPIYYKSNLFV